MFISSVALVSYTANHIFHKKNCIMTNKLINYLDTIISFHSFLVQLIYVGPDEIHYTNIGFLDILEYQHDGKTDTMLNINK